MELSCQATVCLTLVNNKILIPKIENAPETGYREISRSSEVNLSAQTKLFALLTLEKNGSYQVLL